MITDLSSRQENTTQNAQPMSDRSEQLKEYLKGIQPPTQTLKDMGFDELVKMVPTGYDKMAADDGESLTAVMSTLFLPDEDFAIVSEIMLNEMEKAINNIDDKLVLVQSMNASGMKVEEFNQAFAKIIESIEKEMSPNFSAQKVDFLKRYIGIYAKAVNDTVGIAKRIVPVAMELCHPDAKQPSYAKAGDGGMDVYAIEDVEIKPGETKIIPIGVKVALPLGYALLVHPRSGLSAKTKMRVANGIGLIDSGYRGEIGVIIENIEPKYKDFEIDEDGKIDKRSILYGSSMHIAKGERFAQLRLVEVPTCSFYPVDSVAEIGFDRASGFGGTGMK